MTVSHWTTKTKSKKFAKEWKRKRENQTTQIQNSKKKSEWTSTLCWQINEWIDKHTRHKNDEVKQNQIEKKRNNLAVKLYPSRCTTKRINSHLRLKSIRFGSVANSRPLAKEWANLTEIKRERHEHASHNVPHTKSDQHPVSVRLCLCASVHMTDNLW